MIIIFIFKGKRYEVYGESDAVVEALSNACTSNTKVKVKDTKTNEIYILDPHTLIEMSEDEEEVESKLFDNLTEKEVTVLRAMYINTDEVGLPVDTETIKNETGYSKRTIVGVVGSLHKKEILKSYDLEFENEYMISEKAYHELDF